MPLAQENNHSVVHNTKGDTERSAILQFCAGSGAPIFIEVQWLYHSLPCQKRKKKSLPAPFLWHCYVAGHSFVTDSVLKPCAIRGPLVTQPGVEDEQREIIERQAGPCFSGDADSEP
jgi:hypothetical protein